MIVTKIVFVAVRILKSLCSLCDFLRVLCELRGSIVRPLKHDLFRARKKIAGQAVGEFAWPASHTSRRRSERDSATLWIGAITWIGAIYAPAPRPVPGGVVPSLLGVPC